MSKAVYLGKVNLYWCDHCNVPLIGPTCGICGTAGRSVKITPPGDVRPALKHDIKLLKQLFKEVTEHLEFLEKRVVLLNRIPGIDRTEEVIIDGYVIGTIIYTLQTYKLTLKLNAIPFLKNTFNVWVIVDAKAKNAIEKGANLMIPGVISFSQTFAKDKQVIVLDENKTPFAVGVAKTNKSSIIQKTRGVAVKVRYAGTPQSKLNLQPATWTKAVKANTIYLEQLEKKAISKIKNLYSNEAIVSFSGGKDSLVSLLLVLRSGIKTHAFFLDTGIELPETVEYVKQITALLHIDIDIIEAKNAFWRALSHFGPPGRDYRWCCKTCKLGPTTRYIIEKYGKEIKTIVGQRSYESAQRARSGAHWKNPWVPNQKAYSVIQHWNALAVWLYIFKFHVPYNPWYDYGLSRVGCFLCPSSDLADLKIIQTHYQGYMRWQRYLENYAQDRKLPKEWITLGLWRWNNFPPWVKNLITKYNIALAYNRHERSSLSWTVTTTENYTRLTFNKPLNKERLNNMLSIIKSHSYYVENNDVFVLNHDYLKKIEQLIVQAEECVGCGICTGRCPYNAIFIKDQKAWISSKQCKGCGVCLGACPVYTFHS